MTEKRALESIEEIEQELAGDLCASSMALMDVKFLVSYKCYASVELSHSAKCVLVLLIYKGASLREL